VAKRFDVPEYRISRVLRYHLGARNFNQYINALRIEHAKKLLAAEQSRNWPIVVIALESGFASVGPFSRAFKSTVGCTPGEYRQQMCRESLPCFALSTEHQT
jgi:AraC-like DNA-binding protein